MEQELKINEQFFNEPLLTTPLTPPNFKKVPWRSMNTPSAILILGDKRSGKDISLDIELEIAIKYGLTAISIFDGGGFEKLYCAINKDCKLKWDLVNSILKIFETKKKEYLNLEIIKNELNIDDSLFKRTIGLMISEKLLDMEKNIVQIINKGFDELEGKLLHCNCYKSIPVTVIKPPYVKYSKEALDRFNGHYFKNLDEYVQAFIKGFVNELPPVGTDYTKIKKSKSMISKIIPKLKIIEAPVPRLTSANINGFLKIFTEELIDCRKNRRFLVACNPSFYPSDSAGKTDKYTTFAVIMDNLKAIADKHFIPLSLNKPRNQWTNEEKSWHKICLLVSEIRKPAPSSGLSPDKESGISKKAFYSFMPESRHAKTFVRINAQSIGDVFKGVNKQNDIIIVKRSSNRNLTDEMLWLSAEMDKAIEIQLVKWRIWDIIDGVVRKKTIAEPTKARLIKHAGLCKISELPDNKAIVVNGNGQWRMTTYNTPSWHHKSDRDEFGNDTGIIFTFDKSINDRMSEGNDKNTTEKPNSTRSTRELIYADMTIEMKIDEIKYETAYKNLLKKYENDPEKKSVLEKSKWKSFGESFHRWELRNKK